MAGTTESAAVDHSTWMGYRTIRQAGGACGRMPFACCACGWEGPGRLRRSAAVQDAMDHLDEMTGASAPAAQDRDPRTEAEAASSVMRDAGFPVVPPGEIAAEVAEDVHRLGLDQKPGRRPGPGRPSPRERPWGHGVTAQQPRDADPAAPAFWRDYRYNAGRARPVGVTHCQEHHEELEASDRAHAARGGTVRGYSVKLRPSEPATCLTCGKTRP